jgi:hypothetical protein
MLLLDQFIYGMKARACNNVEEILDTFHEKNTCYRNPIFYTKMYL